MTTGIILACLWILGIHSITRRDKLLSFISNYITCNQEDIDEFEKAHLKVTRLAAEFYEEANTIDLVNDIEKDWAKLGRSKFKELRDIYDSMSDLKVHQIKQNKIRQLLNSISPALTECLVCMSPWHGGLILFLAHNNFFDIYILSLFIYIMAIVGAISLIESIYSISMRIKYGNQDIATEVSDLANMFERSFEREDDVDLDSQLYN